MQSIYKLYSHSYGTHSCQTECVPARMNTVYIVQSGSNAPSAPITKQHVGFLSTMAEKLQELSEAVESKIEYIIKTAVPKPTRLDNHILASVDTPNMNLTVGAEYILYVQKYGPPPLGKFDPAKLAIIREEYNIGKENATDVQAITT